MIKMKLVFYKQTKGFEEEKTTLTDLLNIAEGYKMDRKKAEKLLKDPQIGEISFEKIRLWTEEA